MKDSKYIFNTYFFCFLYLSWVFFIHACGSQYFTLFNTDVLLKYFNSFIIVFLLAYFILSYKVNKNIFLDGLLAVVFIIGYTYFQKSVLVFIFIIMCRDVPFSLIVKSFLLASLLGMLFILCTYALSLYPKSSLDLFREDGYYRYLLGYRFPTFLPNYYFHMVLGWVFLRKERIKLIEIISILVINVPIYQLTDTRAVFFLVILTCAAVMALKYGRVCYSTFILGRTFSFLTKYSFVIFAFIAIYFQYTYDSSIYWMASLNSAFSGRLFLGHMGFELYNITPFGNLVEFVTMLEVTGKNKFFYIDSAYVQLLLVYGVIIFSLILIAYTRIGYEIIKRNDKYFGLVLILLFAHSLTDPQLMSPEFNPFMMCLGYYGLARYKNNLFR